MKNWKGDLAGVEQADIDSGSLPVGSGVFTFIKMVVNGRVSFGSAEVDNGTSIMVRSYV